MTECIGLDTIIRQHTTQIRSHLEKLGLAEYTVQDEVVTETRSPESLVFVEGHVSDDVLALMISGQGASYRDIPISILLSPVTPLERFVASEDCLGVTFFYELRGTSFTPVMLEEPVDVAGVFIARDDTSYQGPRELLINGPYLQRIVDKKLITMKLLRDAGIQVPRSAVLRPKEQYGSIFQICDFLKKQNLTDFVIKANEGSQGQEVRMFTYPEVAAAATFAEQLIADGHRVYVEERIEALLWQDDGGTRRDWNIRAFTTLEREPRWIDGIVRYAERNGHPVNICQGARVEEVSVLAQQTGFNEADIQMYATKVAKAIVERILRRGEDCAGWLGLDLIVSQAGIYVIEANDSQSGAYAELCQLRKKPLESVSEILLPSLGRKLFQNAKRTKLAVVKREVFSLEEKIEVAQRLESGKDFPALIAFCDRALQEQDNPQLSYFRGKGLCELGRFDEALAIWDRLRRDFPHDQNVLYAHVMTLVALKRYDEALPGLQTLIGQLPKDVRLLCAFGDALSNRGDHASASSAYLIALALATTLEPEHSDELYLSAVEEAFKAGNTEFFHSLIEFIQIQPHNVRGLHILANQLYIHTNLIEAAAFYQRILEHDSNDVVAKRRIADHHAVEGKFAEAESLLREVGVENLCDAYFQLGNFLHEQGRMNDAWNVLKRAHAIDRKHGGVIAKLTLLARDQRRQMWNYRRMEFWAGLERIGSGIRCIVRGDKMLREMIRYD